MRPARTFCVGSHPCQGYRKTSYNDSAWGPLSTGSLKFRPLKPDGANGEVCSNVFNRVNLDLCYPGPPTKGGQSHGTCTMCRCQDPPHGGPGFDQSHRGRVCPVGPVL